MNNISAINEIVSVFLIIIVGIIASRKKIITDEINKGLTDVLLKVTTPLLIVSSFNFSYSEAMKANILKSFFYSLAVFIITPFISYVFLYPVKDKKKKILQFANVFSNCGFIGFAAMDRIYGAEGVAYAAIFNMLFNLFIWTYGVALFSDKLTLKDAKKVLLNPGIVAVFVGAFIMIFNIKFPAVITKSMQMVGSINTPLSMIILGVLLSKADFKGLLKDWTMYYGTFLKLILIPGVFYLISLSTGDNSKIMRTMIILQAMPAAATTSIFAESFNKEKQYSAGVVFLTTLICLITLPVILRLIQ